MYGVAFSETIEKIIIEGNKKVSKDTILFYMRSGKNGVYSKTTLREDFKSLWNTGFFENIIIESDDGEKGKIIKLILKENPLIKSISYKTGKKIKEKDIRETLQENNISLLSFSYYDPSKMKKVKKIIEEMLKEKGYNEGKVNIITKKDKDQVTLTVQVIQGPRTRIGDIVFPGLNTRHVSPSFLHRGLKNNKPHNLFSTLGRKDVYNKEKITEDLEEVRLRLQQKGFLEAKVGTPSISTYKKHTVTGKTQKMLKVSIPVDTGPQYKVGNVNIDGNKIVKTDFLERFITLEKGNTYNMKKRNKIREDIEKLYHSLSYIYCQVVPMENLDPVRKVADLTLKIHEGEMATMGRLKFKGNTFTKDKVLRREWLIKEGKPLSMSALETSITRMRQLGLVSVEKAPEFQPDPKNPQKVDVSINVKEINRQSLNFNAGYSGYDGLFVALGYSTRNFMGGGETFSANLQLGTRAKQYSLSFTEPYLFHLPASLGVSVHNSSLEYPFLSKKSTGFGFSTSARLWGYWGASLAYNFEDVESAAVDGDDSEINSFYRNYYNYSGTISSISPTLYYSSVDSPIFPHSGTKILFNYRYSGGLLGGDVNLHKTKFQFLKYIPIGKRHTLGMQLVHQSLTAFGNKSIPTWEKFFLGEQSIRGFGPYGISPRNENGDPIGGNKAFYLNLQYEIPLNRQFSAIFFYDMGNAYDFGVPISLKDVYSSMGLELKVFVPMLNVPFRLIFAYNPRIVNEEDPHFDFRFTVGTSFN